MTSHRGRTITGGKAHGGRDMKTHLPRRISGARTEIIAAHEDPARQAKSESKIKGELPKSLHRKIALVHRLAQGAGLFLEDRPLLECARCGLLEDVGCYGLLMTYFSGKPAVDSGLRFRKDKLNRYICPNCGAVAGIDKEGRTAT